MSDGGGGRIITLTTDFGLRDPYVAAIKGVALSIAPAVRFVDVSHDVAPQDALEAGFVLAAAFPHFPPETIHILVVDPGVGTARRLLLARTENHFFLAPDNGALGPIFAREPARQVHEITEARYFRGTPSPTFHGRDILAPVAAHLARGTDPARFGPPAESWATLTLPAPRPRPDGGLELRVIRIDRFGNLILNLDQEGWEAWSSGGEGGAFRLSIEGTEVTRLFRTYAESPDDTPFALLNSWGYLEIAVRNRSAAERIGARPGHPALLSR